MAVIEDSPARSARCKHHLFVPVQINTAFLIMKLLQVLSAIAATFVTAQPIPAARLGILDIHIRFAINNMWT